MTDEKKYQRLRELKLGNRQLKGPLKKLQVWFNDYYKIMPISIIYSYIKGTDCSRIQFIFEKPEDTKNFIIDKTQKEIITSKFQEYITGYKKYKSKNLIILTGYFYTLARINTILKITNTELYELAKNIGLTNIHSIFREPYSTCYILFNDKASQNEYASHEFIELFKKGYLRLLKRNDEFDYHSKKTFEIKFWNKVEFDETYDNFYHFAHG